MEALADCTQGILLQDRTKTMGQHGKGTGPPVCWPAPLLSAEVLSFPKGIWDRKCLWSLNGWFLILRYRSLSIYHFCMLVPLPATNSHISLPDKLLLPQDPGTMWTPLKSIPHCPQGCRELYLTCEHTALWLSCTFNSTRSCAPKGRDLKYLFLYPCWEPI